MIVGQKSQNKYPIQLCFKRYIAALMNRILIVVL